MYMDIDVDEDQDQDQDEEEEEEDHEVVEFDDDHPYSRSVLEFAEQFEDFESVSFVNMSTAVVVDYLPASTRMIRLLNSPNITFRGHFNTRRIIIHGPAVGFNDVHFRIDECHIYNCHLQPNQLTLRNTIRLIITNTQLYVGSLRNAKVYDIYFRRILGDLSFFTVPELADIVQIITIVPNDAIQGSIYLTNIPESIQAIRVATGELSDDAFDMIHRHTQRLRYLYGQDIVAMDVIYFNREIESNYDRDDGISLDFAQEDHNRETMADGIEAELNNTEGDQRRLPTMLNNEIMQYIYGDYYGQPRLSGAGARSRSRNEKSKSERKSKRKSKSKSKLVKV